MKKEQIQNLLSREMTRKEFLATLGLGIASIVGMGAIIRMLFNNKTSRSAAQSRESTLGYGSSAYGGNKNS